MVIEHLIHTKPLLAFLVIGLLGAANLWLWRHAPPGDERGEDRRR
jgi:hypothetical protein